MTARHLELKRVFRSMQALQASVGELNGDAALSATGNSVASLLGASDGELKIQINQGTVSKLLLEEMGLNIGNVILTKIAGDGEVKVNCMVTDLGVIKGLMQSRSFIVDTDEAVLNVSGNIDLTKERLDLTVKPDSKGLRACIGRVAHQAGCASPLKPDASCRVHPAARRRPVPDGQRLSRSCKMTPVAIATRT